MTAKTVIQSQWIGFLFLLPFVIILAVHDALGLSDAFLLVKDQRDHDSQMFNLAMAVVFYLSVGGFIVHTAFLAGRSKPWLWVKVAFLAAWWSAIVLLR